MEEPPPKFFRLAPGREVRLRSAYFVTCTDVVKDADGQRRRAALHVRPGHARRRRARRPRGPRRRSTGCAAAHAVPAEVRLYDHLFVDPYPGADGRDLFEDLNPASETVLRGCVRRAVAGRCAGRRDRPVRAAGLLLRRTPIRRRTVRSSTGRSRSRTRGRRSVPRAPDPRSTGCAARASGRRSHSGTSRRGRAGRPAPRSRPSARSALEARRARA